MTLSMQILTKNYNSLLRHPKVGDLNFLDLKITINDDRKFTCLSYKKLIDTGIILNFCNCAQLQNENSVIQGTVHTICNATRDWQSIDVALDKSKSGLKISIQLSGHPMLLMRR